MIRCNNCGKYLDSNGDVLEDTDIVGCINKKTGVVVYCDECEYNYDNKECIKYRGMSVKVKDLD